jgi:D-glycero-alpha-D-manno-heptose-7-phosphate kinase
MIITRTPLRISFFGGGTDYPDFYSRHGGEVLSTTIDKYSYILLNDVSIINDYKYKVAYKQIERSHFISEINHPIVKNCLQLLSVSNADITYYGDLPARTGLGASSAFTIGLLKALYHRYKIEPSNHISIDAIQMEREICKENVGDQDQIACSVGGLNHIIFNQNGERIVKKLYLSEKKIKELEESCLLFYTNEQRFSSDILAEQMQKTKNMSNDDCLLQMKDMVGKALFILNNNSTFDDFGKLLGDSWELKKRLSSQISNEKIDMMYQIAIDNGAVGGKLLGAGAGGFLLLYVPLKNQLMLRKAMSNYKELLFKFETTGVKIIYDEP